MTIYVFNKIKERKVTTTEMLQKATRAYLFETGITPKRDQKIIIERTKEGKPYFRNLPVYFSISHSGDICVIVFSRSDVGIDIEEVREINKDKISERYFTAEEADYLKINNTREDFYRVWTRKEAYAKLVGVPLLRIMKRLNTVEDNNLPAQVRNMTFKEVYIERGYVCTMVSTEEDNEITYEKM